MSPRVYYNEIDEGAVAWLRSLIAQRAIPDGEIDTRSIVDVRPDDLRGFNQCHFFAGIGGWACALRLAGWPDDREVWTGSCPCQPFSVAGAGQGTTDPRHLWPTWFRLIAERRPRTVFGEQVASVDGEYWLDLVLPDMEGIDYAIGAFDLPAASVGAPHKRQRFWFVADALRCGVDGDVVNAERAGLEGLGRHGDHGHEPGRFGADTARPVAAAGAAGFWDAIDWLPCSDGKARPVEPGTFPLAHGIPARVGRLRGYGNAIVPQVAAALIESYLGVRA